MDNKYRVLYYPHFQPKPSWLRSVLLLTDQVDRIVPANTDPQDPDVIKELIQEIPGTFISESPEKFDVDFDISTLERLRRAFRYIREQSFPEEKPKISISIGKDGSVGIDGHVFLHHAKVGPRVRDILIEERMLLAELEELTQNFGAENTYPIPEAASNLILACIADRIARREGIDTVTDQELAFLTTSLDVSSVGPVSPPNCVEGSLLSAIATISIPKEIEQLPIKTYQDLRESYAPIREAFKEYVTHIAAVNRLYKIEDREVLSSRIATAAERIKTQTEQYSKTLYARRFKEWGIFAIGSMMGIGGAVTDSFALTFASGAISVEVVKKIFIEDRKDEKIPEACRLLASMRKDILKRVTINAF